MPTEAPDIERERRAELVRRVRSIIESAGGHGAEDYREDQDAWVRGDITMDDLMERVLR